MIDRQLSTRTATVDDIRTVVAVAIERHPSQRARIEKGATIVVLRSIVPDPAYAYCFSVESESEPGRFYSVDASVWVCSCPDYQNRSVVCGHQWAVRLLTAVARLHSRQAVAVAA